MNRFAVITPADLPGAAKLLSERGNVAIAGGVDVMDLLKQDLIEPKNLVNLKGLTGHANPARSWPSSRYLPLDAILLDDQGGMRIGALVKLSAVADDPELRQRYPAIAEAAGEAATPQIRNLATAGGNLLQRPRCWYFRNPDVDCLKKGGLKCYAAEGLNRYHAILGGGPSYIVHPSNLAPALIAADASVRLVGPNGERIVELEKFFTLPKADPLRENALESGEVLTEILIPAPPRNARSVYLEAREKRSFDWPLASVAVMVAMAPGGMVRESRIVMGAVAPIPWRAPAAERVLVGARLDQAVAARTAEAALIGAAPLRDNGYKVPIAKTIVRRAILRAGGIQETA
jgi:xanthine dehydrogenase YagS FAD-binding subunit